MHLRTAHRLRTVLCAAAGMLATFVGVTNCPIATMFLGFELFGFEQCRTLRWRSPSALRCRDIMVSTADRSLHTPRRRRSLLTGRRTKGIRPCFSTSAVRYYGNTPWVSRFFRDIRLLFYCGDVMIIVTGPYTCGAVMNHRAVVLSICPGVMRVKRETRSKACASPSL